MKLIFARLIAVILPFIIWWFVVKYLVALISNRDIEQPLTIALFFLSFYVVYKGIVFVERKFEKK